MGDNTQRKPEDDADVDSSSTAAARAGAAHGRSATDGADDLDNFRVAGPLRRNAGLLLVIAAAAVLGPLLSRYLTAYRAIVLEVDSERMLVAEETRPPQWIDGVTAAPGDIVEKAVGSWGPEKVSSRGQDHKLQKMYERYAQTYTGVITAINPPVAPGAASTAVVQLDSGGRIHVPLWAEHLAAAAVGVRVQKNLNSWDPVLVEGDGGQQGLQPRGGP